VTGSSITVLSNLAYLIGAVVVAIIIGLLVWLRHRQPKSVDANMASFRRGLSVLAPDPEPPAKHFRTENAPRSRPAPALTHVRLEPSSRPQPGRSGTPTAAGRPASGHDHTAAEEAVGDGRGGESG
jgi:hypothetical protein